MKANLNGRYHPNAPTRLIDAVNRAGGVRKFASQIGINHSYVSQLLHHGIEPGNEDIRVKLFLPRKKRKKREMKPEEFPGQKRIIRTIRRLHRDTTRSFKKWRNTDDKKST